MVIRNGLLALPGNREPTPAEVRIKDGRIVEIGASLAAAGDVIDARGLWVLPGAIDPHVHFFDPGYPHKDDFYHATAGSASGGVTMVVDMPSTSIPTVTSGANLREKLAIVSEKALIDFGFFGGVPGETFQSAFPRVIREMAPDVLGFKCYATSGMEGYSRLNHFQFTRLLTETRELARPVLLHAEDFDYVAPATAFYKERGDDPRAFYESRPELAEVLSVMTACEIARTVRSDLHIVHLGVGRAAEIVASYREVTGETCPQYLAFDVEDFQRIGAPLKITPPVKGPANKDRLWELLRDGSIDFVASDHAPGTRDEKNTGSIWTDYAGIPGGPTIFPYVLSEGLLAGRLPFERFLEVTSHGAAKRYGVADRKGSIEVGKDADLVFVDPDGRWTVRGADSLSKGKITPFEGMELRGVVEATFVRGTKVYDRSRGIVAEAGVGNLQRAER